MKFKLYKEFGALNSVPVFEAISSGIKRLGFTEVQKDEDVSVIWSVLWNGRMLSNRNVYEKNKQLSKKTLILEVGSLKRGITWKISVDNINGLGIFGNKIDLDNNRPIKLGVNLKEYKNSRKDSILIACQHDKSLQWQGNPPLHEWVNSTITQIKQYSNRPIVVRPHPRCPLKGQVHNGQIEIPKKVLNTYDDYDIDYDYHCVINFNSGPATQAAISGVPIICDRTSLAYPVSDSLANIENIILPDRSNWFLQLCHTEWTIEEIASGEPLLRVMQEIT